MKVIVTDCQGRDHELEALDGWRVMEVIRDWGVPMKAECGGAGICGTCHVQVDPAWLDRLPEPTDDELDQLDKLDTLQPNSRLSCQILMREDLDGLRVRLTAEAGCDSPEFAESEAA
ncbi:2Fe-2S iron-sulfur cluster-binding protein [Microbaculum marinum]|uniref:2Fe-2S iron-sulfur cluster-binding protein n=1 Tax=Microbaculum marinum TaxID=1764581 RepID=A0AAW9S1E5_9HYPH